MFRVGVVTLTIAGAGIAFAQSSADPPSTTDVVILGVSHSAMLVAESYQPAVFRAYFDRIKPAAICIERAPEEFARGSHYEFTYEIQHIAVPYAREHGINLCPFDWLPSADDQRLAFGVDLEEPPFLRGPDTYADFLVFRDPPALQRDIFYAERAEAQDKTRSWSSQTPSNPRFDFARRLFLYRTFLQAMRIAKAASGYRGSTILVIVGDMHLPDLRDVLGQEDGIRLVSPAKFERPAVESIRRHTRRSDLAAIATFNLLGVQHTTGNIDMLWLRRVVAELETAGSTAETRLFLTRLKVLAGELSSADAGAHYREIAARADAKSRFTWDGVRDRRRLDSFFDPFGNLTIAERARLEAVRELRRAGDTKTADVALAALSAMLPAMKSAQLAAYSKWLSTLQK